MFTLLTFLVSFFIIFFSYNFDKNFWKYTEIVMKEHQNTDFLAEETFRNIKRVLSLGAKEKLIWRIGKLQRIVVKVLSFVLPNQESIVQEWVFQSSLQIDCCFSPQFSSSIINATISFLFFFLLFTSNCTTSMNNSVDLYFQNLTSLSAVCLYRDLWSCDYLLAWWEKQLMSHRRRSCGCDNFFAPIFCWNRQYVLKSHQHRKNKNIRNTFPPSNWA